jgi:sec-independent protein translocase protein TatA
MGDLGVPELLIILAVVIVIFGPGKLADLGRALGTGIKEFRRGVRDDATPEPQIAALHTTSSRPLALDDDWRAQDELAAVGADEQRA